MKTNRAVLPLLAAALLLGACDAGDQQPATEEAVDTLTRELAPEPGDLMPINRSEVRGRATIDRDGDDLRVVVQGEGLEPGAAYTAHVHEGECAAGGPIRLPLGRMTATPEGTGSLRMRVSADRLPTEGNLFVQIHAPDDSPVACADIDPED